MPPDPSNKHARLRVCERAFIRYYHPAAILSPPPPPTSKSCMKPWIQKKHTFLQFEAACAIAIYSIVSELL